ncbi:hypothetical protein BKA65DRAFT_476550 [Rhexocercosporidium sp. MPI-PUGE-AT-0058]|nr:hypothetical protein BKA65DRAFT_476550 [Rhexocercosporidium sp. MPI-PUGE-AT-0058]
MKKRKAQARLQEEEEQRLIDELSGLPAAPPDSLFTFRKCLDKEGIGVFALGDIKKGIEILVEEGMFRDVNEWIAKEALFKCNCKATTCLETPLMKAWGVNAYNTTSGPMLYPLAARFNHDCFPNVARGFSKEDHIVFCVARDIKRGEELTINYIFSPISPKPDDANLSTNSVLSAGNRYQVAGRRKAHQRRGAVQAEVKAWSEEVETNRQRIEEGLYGHLKMLAMAGDDSVADSKGRAVFVERSIGFLDTYLKGNSKFGFDDASITIGLVLRSL